MGAALAVRKSLVEQAFELAVPVPKVEGIEEELQALLAARSTLLPVEERAQIKLGEQIEEMQRTLVHSKYPEPVLPLEPLSWRWSNGLPKLALLSLRSSSFNITAARGAAGSTATSMNPELPHLLARQYEDVTKLARDYCTRRDSRKSFTFTFEGTIPAPTRMKIVEAMKSYRFEGLYMLCEAPAKAWKVESRKGISRRQQFAEAIANIDPLILGWAEEALFVIDKFDLTTLEEYVLSEFTQKALPAGR